MLLAQIHSYQFELNEEILFHLREVRIYVHEYVQSCYHLFEPI
jgi:hypothetical protein